MKRLFFFGLFFLVLILGVRVDAMEGFLTSEEMKLFYQQGYFLKKNALSQEEIKQLDLNVSNAIEKAMLGIVQSEDQTVSEQDQMLFIDGSRIVFKRKGDHIVSIARINGVAGMEPSLLDYVRSEKLVHTFFELLNTTDLEHIISQIHPKLPGDGVAYPKHRDIQFRKSFDPEWQDILGNGSYAICIIPVDPMSEENGGLWIDRNNYPEDLGLEEDRVWITAEPGDLLFMHPHLFHGSGPNLSTKSRRTLLTGFCAYGANHKPYPGAQVNVHITKMEDGTIAMQPAPWSKDVVVSEGNH